MTDTVLVTKNEIVNELWRRGQLSWLLFDYQLPIYHAVREAMNDGKLKYTLNCSRRFGKTSVLSLIAMEEAMQNKNHQVRFAAPTGKELRKAVYPIIQIFLETCPEELKPKFNSQDNSFKFPNGSEIHLAGVNGQHADDLRGTNSHLNIVDEAGSIDDLKYLIQSVLIPQTLTTGGMTVLASTPALSQDHEYYSYYEEAKLLGHLSEFTVYDNTSLSPERIEQIAEDCGGVDSTDFQREYMCRWVTDSELAIIPEYDDKFIEKYDRDEYDPFYHRYLSMDLGVVDLTAILYATYDFRKATLYVEAEDIINGPDMTTESIYTTISGTERDLWGNHKVYKRVADNNNLLLLHDLSKMHELYVKPTNKDSLEAMVSEVRIFVQQGRLKINPSCKHLIGCLKFGIWNKKAGKREFARSTSYGHYDALAALVYLIRNLDPNINPIPPEYNVNPYESFVTNGALSRTDFAEDVEALKKAFKINA